MKHGIIVWLCACLVCFHDGEGTIIRLENGELVQHEAYRGSPLWKIIPLLWVPKTINVTCPSTKDFSVYSASSLSQLSEKVDRNENVWCGWQSLFGKHSCIARLTPFGSAHLGVQHASIARHPCTFALEESLSVVLVLQTILGSVVFLSAGRLSSSMIFRLGTGSAGFMALSILILLLFVSRSLPSKRSGVALFAIFGSSFTGVVRYVFGQWIPSVEQLVYNKVILAYLGVSGLVGLAVTYYYDREDNDKLHFIMKCGLKLVGLVLVAFGTTSPAASITLCVVLIMSQALRPILDYWHKGESQDLKDLTDAVSEMYTTEAKPKAVKPETPQSVRQRPARQQTSTKKEVKEAASSEEGDEPQASLSSEAASENAFVRATKIPLSDDDELSEGSPSQSFVPLGAAETDSPWLKKGLALNMETGRTVKMHGPTWNKLMLQGYELDRGQGTLTPPSKKRESRTVSKTRHRRRSVENGQ